MSLVSGTSEMEGKETKRKEKKERFPLLTLPTLHGRAWDGRGALVTEHIDIVVIYYPELYKLYRAPRTHPH